MIAVRSYRCSGFDICWTLHCELTGAYKILVLVDVVTEASKFFFLCLSHTFDLHNLKIDLDR